MMTKGKAEKYLAEQKEKRDHYRAMYVINERDTNPSLDVEYLDYTRCGTLVKTTGREQLREEYVYLIHRANRFISELERFLK